ncbi:uncharacterized protein B0I36DRAFT_331889 [Microdochium trichocladiopsis]|uniref:Uncharacterized protein n=1 Tax=Microdochium trichocladiopsis TaxID=1682393 RepID=A0A9P8XXN8_9PEZI|nr:uncharacterized protein B0I36DRAFT_331889 [Microdochium trichocladiopsis]KAH7024707.1 hypothetical protein B0I36DRAFT_331889 [Microdochium trichocladiopsis]
MAAPAPTTMDDLKAVITPELLQLMVTNHLGHPRTSPLNYYAFITSMFTGGPAVDPALLHSKVWPALLAISRFPGAPASLTPSLLAETFLPPPEDPTFPDQALGLILLLDQGPRTFCKASGDAPTDVRYTDGFFAHIALPLARWLLLDEAQGGGLSEPSRPNSWARWESRGVTPDYYVLVRFMFGAVLVHAEEASARAQARAYTEAARRWVEERYGVTDPFRDAGNPLRQELMENDLYGFPRMVTAMVKGELPDKKGLEEGKVNEDGKPWMGVAQGFFFLALLFDVHLPLLEGFGRYPYRNGAMGRVHTPEEVAWMAGQDMFKELPDELRARLREDVEAGKWTPLGGEPS